MRLLYSPITKSNKRAVLENVKQGKMYVDKGKLPKELLQKFIKIDPTKTRKFVGWMSKQWINKTVTNLDILSSTVEDYNIFLEKGKVKTKDINQFKTFSDLANEVEEINKTGTGVSVKDLESDYETVIDNSDLLVMVPHTHEASRKLGLTHFSYRECKDTGDKDSAWCTTYKAPDQFISYYFRENITFYYVKVRSEKLKQELKDSFGEKGDALVVAALSVLEDGKIDGWDGEDRQLSKAEVQQFIKITGLS